MVRGVVLVRRPDDAPDDRMTADGGCFCLLACDVFLFVCVGTSTVDHGIGRYYYYCYWLLVLLLLLLRTETAAIDDISTTM